MRILHCDRCNKCINSEKGDTYLNIGLDPYGINIHQSGYKSFDLCKDCYNEVIFVIGKSKHILEPLKTYVEKYTEACINAKDENGDQLSIEDIWKEITNDDVQEDKE